MQRQPATRVAGRRQRHRPPPVLRVRLHQILPLAPFRAVQVRTKTGPRRDRLALAGKEAYTITTRQGKQEQVLSELREKRSCQSLLRAWVSPCEEIVPIRIRNRQIL